jgi:hypothetical protein
MVTPGFVWLAYAAYLASLAEYIDFEIGGNLFMQEITKIEF